MTIEQLIDGTFEERVLNSDPAVLVLFWRGEMGGVEPDLSKISNDYSGRLRVAGFKTDRQDIPMRYVRGVPELVLFKEQDVSKRPPRNDVAGAKIEDFSMKGIVAFLSEHKITPPL